MKRVNILLVWTICVCFTYMADGAMQGGGDRINMCVDKQYDNNGECQDAHHCYITGEEMNCAGDCSKYVTTGDVSSCKACFSSGAAFWKSCDLGFNTTYLPGSVYSSGCTGQYGDCGCDDGNWVLSTSLQVPCYHATGSSC